MVKKIRKEATLPIRAAHTELVGEDKEKELKELKKKLTKAK
jgi:hypothetical protein